VFILYGEVSTIGGIVEKIKTAGKMAVVHMDLVAGLSGKIEAVDFISVYTKADGIISTRIEQVRHAKELGLSTIYRIFLIDSKVLDKLGNRIGESADIVEILPGLMPKMITKLSKELRMPIIAGGLISDKEDVMAALKAGAIIAGADEKGLEDMDKLAQAFGLAFQIYDDILDEISTFEELGKTVGKDKDANKLTYTSLYGLDAAREKLDSLFAEVYGILSKYRSVIFEQIIDKMKDKLSK